MENIIRGLYVGSDKDVPTAKARIYARLCACKDGEDSHRSMLGYTTMSAPEGKNYLTVRDGDVMALNLIDVDDPEMIPDKVLDEGLMFIREMQEKRSHLARSLQRWAQQKRDLGTDVPTSHRGDVRQFSRC